MPKLVISSGQSVILRATDGLCKALTQSRVEIASSLVVVVVSPTGRFGDDLVDESFIIEMLRGQAESFSRSVCLCGILPKNRSAPLRSDDGVDCFFVHESPITEINTLSPHDALRRYA